jgi:hypothetical protein
VLVIAAVTLAPARAVWAQGSTDVIRGRVTDADSSRAIQGVEVKATSYRGGVSKTATTDRTGRFTIIFIDGEGDYWVYLRKLGFAPKRFEIKKVGDEEVMIADAQLSSAIVSLDAVDVVAKKNRAIPDRNSKGADVGGGDKALATSGVPPDQAGNLAAMAASVAGFQLIPGLDGAPDMYSVLGLSGDQNNVTFNGLGSGISALPPDVFATTSINPYPFDVSTGGFSGAQISIQTLPGSNFSRRTLTNSTIAPPLEWSDRFAAEQGQKYTTLRLGGNAMGAIKIDELFYNSAFNVSRRFSDAITLGNGTPAALGAAGVSIDSAQRLLRFLDQRNVPVRGSAPGERVQDAFQGLVNADVAPSASGTGHSFTLGLAGNYQRSQPVDRGGLLLATPSHGNETSFWGANASIVHMNYFWFGILSKTTLGLGAQASRSDPFQQVPEGMVRVTSSLPDGASSVKALSFGGNTGRSSSSSQTVQFTNQLTWFSLDNAHTIRLTSAVARDAFSAEDGQRLNGSFTFNSLGDLEAGSPSSFVRTLSATKRSGSQLAGSIAVGDYWRPAPSLQVQYGVRLDANRFLTVPGFNPVLRDALGVHNDRVPNRGYVSPRVGLQWAYGKAPVIQYAPGSARPPLAVIHAGIGVFQNLAPSQLVAPALNATGLPSSTQSITCVGAAVPFPRWDAFVADPASIPTTCADGSAGSPYAATTPSVTLFDGAYRQPRSLRAAADWSGAVFDNRFVLGIQGVWSAAMDQPGVVDLNVARTPQFTLSDERERPVFVAPNVIVPSTGAIAAGARLVSPAFQRVLLERSDLRASAKQLSVNLRPVTANRWLKWDVTYTLLDAREQFFGYSSTVGDPFARESGRPLQVARHSITARWSDIPVFDVLYVSTLVQALSGQPFTPMVAGDVNGDGAENDRAFVADPSRSADAALANGMRTLLENGAPAARACLTRQLARLAARGSCQAPWTMSNALLVKLNPARVGLPKRATLSLQVVNPLGLADLALHGGTNLRGWGQRIAPDQNLLFVRGFDPATHRFRYEVNQRFGSTRPRESVTRTLPFLSFGVSIDVGIPRERQLLTQRLDAGRGRSGPLANVESMKNLGTSAIPNPMAMILTQATQLGLTRKQADSLATLSHAFSVFADSVWTPVASHLAGLPAGYSSADAYGRYVAARERTVDFLIGLAPNADALLTSSQRRRLPSQIAMYLDERVLKFLRSSTAGDASALIR